MTVGARRPYTGIVLAMEQARVALWRKLLEGLAKIRESCILRRDFTLNRVQSLGRCIVSTRQRE